jgi:hypothetical protein
MACASDSSTMVMAKLRATVRECPHGILVSTQCLLGELTCRTSHFSGGTVALVQPCTVRRVPTAAVQWIGPVRTQAEADAMCHWIATGEWSRESLPPSLRADRNLTRASRNN